MGPVAILRTVAADPQMKQLVHEHLCGSRHFIPCMRRLVKLTGRYRMAAMSDQDLAENQMALLARGALFDLSTTQEECDACLNQSTRELITRLPEIPRHMTV